MAAVATQAINPADNPFTEFLERYDSEEGIVLFVRELLGAEPDAKQTEVLKAVARGERRISIRSGHRVGKTTTLAWAIVWHATCKFPQKTICTAPTKPQLFDALAAETKAWFKKLPEALQALFEIKSESIHLIAAPDESFITFATSRAETPEALAGKHSKWVFLVVDEASGVPEQVYEASQGSMAGHHATMVLAGNPVRSSGLFFNSHNKPGVMERWVRVHISCIGHPRIAQEFIDNARAEYGELSNAFRVRVLGEFPLADDDTVIPYELAHSALNRDVIPSPTAIVVWGLDVARFGSDSSALAKRKGASLREPVQERYGLDTMQVVGWLKAEYDSTAISERPTEINVDVIGLGAGVVDRGRELGLPVRGINVSESPALGTQYVNLRAELWFKGKESLTARDCNLANDEKLVAELVIPRYTYSSSGKIQVESKPDMKKRGFKSPNRADAYLLTLATDAIVAQAGTNYGSSNWKTAIKRKIKGIV